MHRIHVKLLYSAGLLVVQTDSKTLKTHRIHVKVFYSGSLLVLRTDSKLSQCIEFMLNYIESMWKYFRSTSGSNRFEPFTTYRMHVKILYCAGLLLLRRDIETFETHRIPVKLLHTDGLLVVRTDSKLSQCIEFMWNYSIVLVF